MNTSTPFVRSSQAPTPSYNSVNSDCPAHAVRWHLGTLALLQDPVLISCVLQLHSCGGIACRPMHWHSLVCDKWSKLAQIWISWIDVSSVRSCHFLSFGKAKSLFMPMYKIHASNSNKLFAHCIWVCPSQADSYSILFVQSTIGFKMIMAWRKAA